VEAALLKPTKYSAGFGSLTPHTLPRLRFALGLDLCPPYSP
jgi:hypothetical protein